MRLSGAIVTMSALISCRSDPPSCPIISAEPNHYEEMLVWLRDPSPLKRTAAVHSMVGMCCPARVDPPESEVLE